MLVLRIPIDPPLQPGGEVAAEGNPIRYRLGESCNEKRHEE